jgi:hypothetical protein
MATFNYLPIAIAYHGALLKLILRLDAIGVLRAAHDAHRNISRSHRLFMLKSCRSAGTLSHPGVAMLLTGNCW